MVSNSFTYVSHDNIERDRPLEAKLGEIFTERFITFGRGDVDISDRTERWNPIEYGLAIFIVSAQGGPRTPDWYRLQAELQKMRSSHNEQDMPSTLLFVHATRTNVERNRYIYDGPVLNNILNLGGQLIEYGRRLGTLKIITKGNFLF
jgi:hypothetical protein